MKKTLKRIALGVMLILCVTFIIKTTMQLGEMNRETGKGSLDIADDIVEVIREKLNIKRKETNK